MSSRDGKTGSRKWEHAPDTYGLVEDISCALVCREQNQFLLTNEEGDIPPDNSLGLGLYANDTRHLSTYSLRINGAKPLVLASAGQSGFSLEQVLGNSRGVYGGTFVGRGTVEMVRRRYLGNQLVERLQVTNHNPFEVGVDVEYSFDADFADIFEVRGHLRAHAGNPVEPSHDDDLIRYRYLGADGIWRTTLIQFTTPPDSVSRSDAAFRLVLGGCETRTIEFSVQTSSEPAAVQPDYNALREDYSRWRHSFASLYTDNELFGEISQRAIDDLRTLWTEDEHFGYFAAGVPWYSTLFGRDAIIASMQVLALRPDLARRCLLVLARHQSQAFDSRYVQEPGKILHELRRTELTRIGELPYSTYYGSVDSTPLFILLAAQYYAWTNDLETLAGLREAILSAIRWTRDYGHKKSDPYVRYDTDPSTGLRNQGWKDSDNAIVHEDGSLCEGPIALVEVQSYVYAAYREIAPLLEVLGEGRMAADLLEEAEELKARFLQDFWLNDRRRLALALDGDDRPSAVVSSNAGQALLGGILDSDQAEAVRESLFQNDMFTGWGIRTLSATTKTYFPLGYHVGTVWPHDNALIALGLKRYGFDMEVAELLTGLFDAAQHFPDRRLPELFGGQPRTPYLPPVPYPVACRPQAWAAGSILQLVQTTLGLHADAPHGRLLVVRPRLPFWLERVHLQGLKVGKEEVNLSFRRQGEQTELTAEPSSGLRVIVTDELALENSRT